ncbi:hypothetical protein [Nodosilinea sp. FACHB-13]|uniref:hypothetical protein n=1 Tax=Cyanophyceae TaxID=3028117 RepID=UPI0019CD8CC7|nr:hypothetical protein [Nodosilinea sp. FACHB-13]MBD2107554.1 hypothetical protein [Nodosilinea sp. FACHB-13]
MSHFDRKSLIFYGVAISSVVTLFSVVSRYGTTHLKAPTAIGGNYQLQIEPNEQCSEPPALELRLQQSGVFVNGALAAASSEAKPAEVGGEPFNLDGRWRSPNLDLVGRSPAMTVCGQPVERVAIAGTHEGDSFSGQLTFAGLPAPLTFESEFIPTQTSATEASH